MESNRIKSNLKKSMDNFNLDKLMDLAEAYVGPMIDAIYRRLIDRDFALEDPEVVMLLQRMHQEMNSEAASSGSPLRAAVPPKGEKEGQKVQTNQTMQDLDEMNDELKSTKKELNEMTKSMLQMEEDRDMWRKLFEDCNKKQGQEIERLRQDYKERSEQMALTTAVEKVIPAEYSSWAVPDGALDASRNESNNRDTAPSRNKSSNNPGS